MKEIKIYKKETCPYSNAAMKLLNENKIEVNEIPPEAWEKIKRSTGIKTVPQIFVDGEFFGGYTELAAKIDAEGIEWINLRRKNEI